MKEYRRNLVFLGVCLAIAVALGVANVVNFSAFELVCCMAMIAAICLAIGYIGGGNKEELFAVKEKSAEKPSAEKVAKEFTDILDKIENV